MKLPLSSFIARVHLAWRAFRSFDAPIEVEPRSVGGWKGGGKLVVSFNCGDARLRLDLSADCARFLLLSLPEWSERVFHRDVTKLQPDKSSGNDDAAASASRGPEK